MTEDLLQLDGVTCGVGLAALVCLLSCGILLVTKNRRSKDSSGIVPFEPYLRLRKLKKKDMKRQDKKKKVSAAARKPASSISETDEIVQEEVKTNKEVNEDAVVLKYVPDELPEYLPTIEPQEMIPAVSSEADQVSVTTSGKTKKKKKNKSKKRTGESESEGEWVVASRAIKSQNSTTESTEKMSKSMKKRLRIKRREAELTTSSNIIGVVEDGVLSSVYQNEMPAVVQVAELPQKTEVAFTSAAKEDFAHKEELLPCGDVSPPLVGLEKVVSELSNANIKLKQDLHKRKFELDAAKKTTQSSQHDLASAIQELTRLRKSMPDCEEMERRCQLLQSEFANNVNRLVQIEKARDAAESRATTAENKHQRLSEQLKVVEMRCNERNESDAKNQISLLQEDLRKLQVIGGEKEADIKKLTHQVTLLREQLAKSQESQTQINNLCVQEMNKERENFQHQIAKHHATSQKLEECLDVNRQLEETLSNERIAANHRFDKLLSNERATYKQQLEEALVNERSKIDDCKLEEALISERATAKRRLEEALANERTAAEHQLAEALTNEREKMKLQFEKSASNEHETAENQLQEALANERAIAKHQFDESLVNELATAERHLEEALSSERETAGRQLKEALENERAKAKQQLEETLSNQCATSKQHLEKALANERESAKQQFDEALANERATAKQQLDDVISNEHLTAKHQLEEALSSERASTEHQLSETLANERATAKQQLEEELAKERATAAHISNENAMHHNQAISEMSEKVTKLEDELTELSQVGAGSCEALHRLEDDKASLEARLTETERTLSEGAEERTTLLAEVEELRRSMESERDDKTRRCEELAGEMEAQRLSLQEEICKKKDTLDKAEQLLEKLQKSVEEEESRWRHQLSESERDIERLTAELEASKQEAVVEVVSDLNFAYNCVEKSLTGIVDQMDSRIKCLEDECETLKAERESLNSSIKQLTGQLSEAQSSKGELDSRLTELHQRVQIVEEERDRLSAEMNALSKADAGLSNGCNMETGKVERDLLEQEHANSSHDNVHPEEPTPSES